jgi:membrane-associated phospholipid phosphatase
MSLAIEPWLHSGLWPVVTRLGEAQLMVPTGLALAAWLAWIGQRRAAAAWLLLLGLATALTTASKIAFIGWGIGSASLNFTGFSGHAMFAAAVLPVLLRCVPMSGNRRLQRLDVALGYGVAGLVAVSRVLLHEHSISEAFAGFALGATVSALALRYPASQPLPHGLAAALVVAYLLNSTAAPTLPTHGLVTRIALQLSGHERPYTREMLLHPRQPAAQALAAAADRGPSTLAR